jgi:hypothetical protein
VRTGFTCWEQFPVAWWRDHGNESWCSRNCEEFFNVWVALSVPRKDVFCWAWTKMNCKCLKKKRSQIPQSSKGKRTGLLGLNPTCLLFTNYRNIYVFCTILRIKIVTFLKRINEFVFVLEIHSVYISLELNCLVLFRWVSGGIWLSRLITKTLDNLIKVKENLSFCLINYLIMKMHDRMEAELKIFLTSPLRCE